MLPSSRSSKHTFIESGRRGTRLRTGDEHAYTNVCEPGAPLPDQINQPSDAGDPSAASYLPLAHLLDHEITQYEYFLDVLAQEREFLRTASYDGLLEINTRKSECIARIRDSAQGRSSLTTLSTESRGALPAPLARQYGRLEALTSDIRHAMALNREVIERSLGRVEGLLSLWGQAVAEGGTYCPTGNHDTVGGYGHMVSTQG